MDGSHLALFALHAEVALRRLHLGEIKLAAVVRGGCLPPRLGPRILLGGVLLLWILRLGVGLLLGILRLRVLRRRILLLKWSLRVLRLLPVQR